MAGFQWASGTNLFRLVVRGWSRFMTVLPQLTRRNSRPDHVRCYYRRRSALVAATAGLLLALAVCATTGRGSAASAPPSQIGAWGQRSEQILSSAHTWEIPQTD